MILTNNSDYFTKKQATSTKKFAKISNTRSESSVSNCGSSQLKPGNKFLVDPVSYRRGLSQKRREVFDSLFRLRKCSRIKVSNAYLADQADCDIRWVRRATGEFMADGLMVKRRNHERDINEYVLSGELKRGKRSYALWLDMLPEEQQQLYMLHNMLPGNRVDKSIQSHEFPLNINIIFRDSNFKNSGSVKQPLTSKQPEESMRMRVRARARGSERSEPGEAMQKKSPVVVSEISPAKERILCQYNVTTSEGIKLWAFSDAVIDAVTGCHNLQTFINKCAEESGRQQTYPQWRRYYQKLSDLNLPEKGKTHVVYDLRHTPAECCSLRGQISTESKETYRPRVSSQYKVKDPVREEYRLYCERKKITHWDPLADYVPKEDPEQFEGIDKQKIALREEIRRCRHIKANLIHDVPEAQAVLLDRMINDRMLELSELCAQQE